MDRREAILRELNMYPLWVRRNQPASIVAEQPAPNDAEVDAVAPADASRLGKGEPDTRQPAMGIVEPVLSEVEGPNPSDGSHANVGEFARRQEIASLSWPELKLRVRDCTDCRLRAGCTQTVFGVGDEKADWLFVGEGPGADEDALGEPFVGQAGQLLDNMLAAIRLKRGNNVYIANIVKCRPPGNRNPAADEIAECLPYLERQIALIQPKLIVALGKVASNALLNMDASLASLRGKLHDYHGIPLVVTYHPAYLLRSPSEKAKAWQDLCMAVSAMHGLP